MYYKLETYRHISIDSNMKYLLTHSLVATCIYFVPFSIIFSSTLYNILSAMKVIRKLVLSQGPDAGKLYKPNRKYQLRRSICREPHYIYFSIYFSHLDRSSKSYKILSKSNIIAQL
jgi:hypothetical protein